MTVNNNMAPYPEKQRKKEFIMNFVLVFTLSGREAETNEVIVDMAIKTYDLIGEKLEQKND